MFFPKTADTLVVIGAEADVFTFFYLNLSQVNRLNAEDKGYFLKVIFAMIAS